MVSPGPISEVECDYFRMTPLEAAINSHNGVHVWAVCAEVRRPSNLAAQTYGLALAPLAGMRMSSIMAST